MLWFRLYTDVVNDPKVQLLEATYFKFWINFMCLYSRSGEKLRSVEDIAFGLRETKDFVIEALKVLKDSKLIEEKYGLISPHEWNKRQYKSDNSTERVKRYRHRSKDVSVTPPDTDTEAKTETKTEKHTSHGKRQVTETDNNTKLSDFEEFWSAWIPHEMTKGSKMEAQKHYIKSRKEGISHEVLTDSSIKYIEQCRKFNHKTKHIVTWLRQNGWDGDYDVTYTSNNQQNRGSSRDTIADAYSMALRDPLRPKGTNN